MDFFDISLINFVLFGVACGVFAGLIAGVGNTTMILLAWPILIHSSPIELLIFYVAMITVSEYVGCIPAIYLAIPSESSSWPSVLESKNLDPLQNEHAKAVISSATGSFFGGIFVVVLAAIFIDSLKLIAGFYSTFFFIAIMTLVMLLLAVVSKLGLVAGVLQIVFGLLLGSIGYSEVIGGHFLTFNNYYLYSGLPLVVVGIILFAFIQLYQSYNLKSTHLDFSQVEKFKFNKLYLPSLGNNLLHSVIGFILGLIPGSGVNIASNSSHSVEVAKKSNTVDRISASEISNNAASFSVLLPLLLFGIPIVGSEALLLDIMMINGYDFNSVNSVDLIQGVSLWLIPINLIGLILGLFGVKLFCNVYRFDFKIIVWLTVIFLLFILLWIGYSASMLPLYVITIVALLPLAWVLRKQNTMLLLFCFVIADRYLEAILIRLPTLLI